MVQTVSTFFSVFGTALLFFTAVGCVITALSRVENKRLGAALYGWLGAVLFAAFVGALVTLGS